MAEGQVPDWAISEAAAYENWTQVGPSGSALMAGPWIFLQYASSGIQGQ
ncbi:uncharacterized protein An14g04460 [Aspergillus niger]|uniref:Contig An14c0150, genomic contig n=2 Tax=Aspergillus niger TaxID=5061 RepID=A2R3J0_ASPNC|nr:uncharacterized protein An14g04460 [Aspergillus niger]CAK42008.1 unnamed protein product [Aspergillus niger]